MMELEICKRLADHVLLLIFVGLSVAPMTGELSKIFMYLMESNFQIKWIIYDIHNTSRLNFKDDPHVVMSL